MMLDNANKVCAELICLLIDNLTENHRSRVSELNDRWVIGWNRGDKPVSLHAGQSATRRSGEVTVLPNQAVIWYAGHVAGFVSLDPSQPIMGRQLLLAGDLVAALEQSIQTVVEEGHAE